MNVLRRAWRCTTAALAMLAAACGPPGTASDAAVDAASDAAPDPLDLASCPQPPPDWLDATELPLPATFTAEHLPAMCALRAIDLLAEQASVLCSSENNHGVAEAHLLHALLARYVVHRFDVRTILLESPSANVRHWERYLETGAAIDLESGFSAAGNTFLDVVEAEELLAAFRAIVAELGEPVRLVGFDVAVQADATVDALIAFLQIVEPAEVAMWSGELSTLDYAAGAMSAAALHSQLLANQATYEMLTDAARFRLALRDAANLRDGYRFLDDYFTIGFSWANATWREPGMIRNVEEFLAEALPDEPVLIIAHNWHCGRLASAGTGANGPSPALGAYLASSPVWGSGYVDIAQVYGGGEYLTRNAMGALVPAPFTAGPGTLEETLGSATAFASVVVSTSSDLVPFGQLWTIWNQPNAFVPATMFDGIVYLRSVSATTPR